MTDADITTCRNCENPVTYRNQYPYLVLYGTWDADRDGFAKPPDVRPWCHDCYQKHRLRPNATRFYYRDADQLWRVLAASDGELVADRVAQVVGTRPFVRVQHGQPDLIRNRAKRVLDDDGELHHVEVVSERDNDYTRDEFTEVVNECAGTERGFVYLRAKDETPFGRFPDDADQNRLRDYSDDTPQNPDQ